MNIIKSFKEYFDVEDNIFLEYSLPCKLESKMTWHNIMPRGHV
jgi:hypothetical protein